MADTKISALTAATALAGTEEFPVTQGGSTVKATAAQMKAYTSGLSFIYQNSDYTLTSTVSSQKMFGQTTNGRLTLPVGLYEFDAMIYITGMSATSGNATFDLEGAGTAVISGSLIQSVGQDNNSPLSAGSRTGQGTSGASLGVKLATNGTGTGALSRITGHFLLTTAGTIIPSLALDDAVAAVVKAGTYFRTRLIAGNAVYATGDAD